VTTKRLEEEEADELQALGVWIHFTLMPVETLIVFKRSSQKKASNSWKTQRDLSPSAGDILILFYC